MHLRNIKHKLHFLEETGHSESTDQETSLFEASAISKPWRIEKKKKTGVGPT